MEKEPSDLLASVMAGMIYKNLASDPTSTPADRMSVLFMVLDTSMMATLKEDSRERETWKRLRLMLKSELKHSDLLLTKERMSEFLAQVTPESVAREIEEALRRRKEGEE